jgi:low affinity Fe/Cu permease
MKDSKKKEIKYTNAVDALEHIKRKYKKSHPLNLAFNIFSKKVSDIVGNAMTFIFALLIIAIWGLSGHFFHYSDTWQLIINTGTTIITFLVVFLIQNTQNRDTEILNLKIDELIVAKKGARNHVIDLESLSDVELKELEKEYIKLCDKRTGA